MTTREQIIAAGKRLVGKRNGKPVLWCATTTGMTITGTGVPQQSAQEETANDL